MKKNFLLLLLSAFLFSGCFSLSFLNPFSDSEDEKQERVEIEIPDDAPLWLEGPESKGTIYAIGVTKNIRKDQLHIFKQKALINASQNLSRKIYAKTVNIYREYLEEVPSEIFDKDIEKEAQQVALRSLELAKVKGFWASSEKELYTLIKIDMRDLAEQIQLGSKNVFKVDKNLYEKILSNRAKEDIIEKLED